MTVISKSLAAPTIALPRVYGSGVAGNNITRTTRPILWGRAPVYSTVEIRIDGILVAKTRAGIANA